MPSYKREFVFSGDDLFIYDFPEKTRIIYPPDAVEPVPDEWAAVIRALDRPLGAPPLISQVDITSRVTIAFDDPCLPVPHMTRDPRQTVIEAVIEKLYSAGVKRENIRLICAGGVHRKWTLKEIAAIIGKKVVSEFRDQITCHDAEDPEGIVALESTSEGEDVQINRAALECDLLIYVNLNYITMNGGWKSTAVGLSTYESIRHHHRPDSLKIGSLIDPVGSGMHASINRMGEVLKRHVNLFQIETVINNSLWPGALGKHLTPIGQTRKRMPTRMVRASLPIAAKLGPRVKTAVRNRLLGGYRLIGVNAGKVDEVHKKTLELLFPQQNTLVRGQSDIVVYGVPNFCPYSAFSTINPMLVVTMAMGYYFNSHRNKPLVKKNGVVIINNPLTEQFSAVHHPSYVDFYKNHLPQYANPETIPVELEEAFAHDQNYVDLYRQHLAYHGVHAILAWYWASKGLTHVRQVIAAGADPQVAEKLGLVPAKDLTAAIAMAEETMGKDASLSYHYLIPLNAVDVG
jgi:hypothetical protein